MPVSFAEADSIPAAEAGPTADVQMVSPTGEVHSVDDEAELDTVVGRTLEEGIAARDAGNAARARKLLRSVVAQGDSAERERADAVLRGLPGRWRLAKNAAIACCCVGILLTGLTGWQWFSLPSTAETLQLARSAHIHLRKSGAGPLVKVALLGTRYDYSLNTSIDNVSSHFVNAIVASEDHRFYEHGSLYKLAKFAEAGILCVLRKLNVFSSARACAGNSTISQQLARNLFLSEKRSVVRKLKELLWAIKMEAGLDKKTILELYLNRLYLGRGNFGVELAARSYFLKSARSLTLYEAAFLAAAVKRPGWNWHENREGATRRAELIVALMRRHGYAKPGTRFPSASFQPVMGKRPPHKPYLGHLWQWIRPEVNKVMAAMPDGDYKVLTTLNAEIEVYVERALGEEVARLRAGGVAVSQGAVVAMRPNGEVLAMVGGVGSTLRARGFNRAKRTSGLHTRPPASSFKPFVYLAALEKGMQPESLIDASPVAIAMPAPQKTYAPSNYDGKRYGMISMRDGLVKSINTAAVNLLHDEIGFDRLFDVLRRAGVDVSEFKRQWGVALGSNGVPLIEMVGAYGVFANGGNAVVPHAFSAITTADGKTLWQRSSRRMERVFSRDDIRALNGMLEDVVREGTATRARRKIPDSIVVAGKTGTGDAFVDAWFVGYTPDLVIGVWMGNDTPRRMPGLFGGVGPARVFNRVLSNLVSLTDVIETGVKFP
ncbi:MAG: hypothetical protein HOI95_10995 [Chromatiales bacterium]|nr:hypothetical protein [Chromatiales bacterium]